MRCPERAIARLSDPEAEVSAHYLIDRQGRVVRLVPESERAWHAGAGAWGPVRDVNSHSIGVELCNDGQMPFAHAQMNALQLVLRGIKARWSIPAARVIGHSDCAPGRKVDPGPRFDWTRFARLGLAAPTPGGEAEGDLQNALARAGYTSNASIEAKLAALRLRHRPHASGPADSRDLGILKGLAGQAAIDPVPANG
ncbi:N-acetylmuramoyl-L-alanine amidase AmiD [Palleronia abyssalis]|uniref:N-acetylmuramoyl-L-alanine amidase n=2 Tax=Palleronia abyssalis TaxID=1501240 RepID=A0A2R8BWG0_9RHOB|nr:N-acetylmuramoyl-L-alanine amidase AmiD [Palleronia abyssalis]